MNQAFLTEAFEGHFRLNRQAVWAQESPCILSPSLLLANSSPRSAFQPYMLNSLDSKRGIGAVREYILFHVWLLLIKAVRVIGIVAPNWRLLVRIADTVPLCDGDMLYLSLLLQIGVWIVSRVFFFSFFYYYDYFCMCSLSKPGHAFRLSRDVGVA